MMKMLLFEYRDAEKKFFETSNFQDLSITFYQNNLSEDTILSEQEYDETEIISVFVTSEVTKEVISKFRNLRIIATRSSGYNHIDLQACVERHIAVLNVEGYGERAVAQYTIASMLGLIRNIQPAIRDFRLDISGFDKYTGYDLGDMCVGIIGTGAIGSSVCKILNFFGAHIFAYDYKINSQISEFVDYVSLEDLYKHSNIISLHIPYFPDSYHMISDKEISSMQDGVYIINSSRGELIDSVALFRGIKSGKIAGVALDVLECENLTMYPDDILELMKDASDECLESTIINKKLILGKNVVITPHIAYNTYNAINTILEITFNNIKNCIEGKCSNRII